MNKALTTFGLTKEQLQILFSLECYMVNQDRFTDQGLIDSINPMVADNANKHKWYVSYCNNLKSFLREQDPADRYNVILYEIELQKRILEVSEKTDSPLWKYLVLLECVLFQPYFPMNEEEEKSKVYKGLRFNSEERRKSLDVVAAKLGIDSDYIEKFQNGYEKNVKIMTGYWNKVLIGVGAGLVAALLAVVTAGGSIAAMFAAGGLYGAAAVSSGLAALGGGAIAAGGLGMAGGMAVLVGGGALLGVGAGGSIGMAVASTSPSSMMCESAKVWVVLKEIVMGIFNDTQRAQDIINTMTDKVVEMKKEISFFKLQVNANKEKIKNLEKSVSYLEKMLKA